MHYGYDVETYPNVFTFSCINVDYVDRWYYEISSRRLDLGELVAFLYALRDARSSMVGFNNVGFDYPIIHYILSNALGWSSLSPEAVTALIYEYTQHIFNSKNRFDHIIWQPIIHQIDLFKIHHFDNMAKTQSLKGIEFNMRSVNVGDLPFEPGTFLTLDQIPVLATYNMHDVEETIKFYHHTNCTYDDTKTGMIDFRVELSAKYNQDFTNHNDTKIGKDYFIMRLEEYAPGTCFYKGNDNRRKPRQTSRPHGVPLNDIILPCVQFRNYEFNRILTWIRSQVLTSKDIEDTLTMGVETKGVFKDVNCTINGFRYDFGTGGIHGSLYGASVFADDEYAIIDLDVASYYPNLAIVNRLFPEHLGELFCDIYLDVYNQRKQFAKKSSENQMLKLALNGVYGDSNNIYSPFFDPKYTMSITINGQLLLCMLAESLLDIPHLSLIQINTDGLTVKVPHSQVQHISFVSEQWERITGLELESVSYQAMHIRDVNNYIGVYEDGALKTKGAYESKQPGDRVPLGWHQNMSALVVPKAAEAALVHGASIEEFIRSPDRDIMDFMLRAKVKSNVHLVLVDDYGIEHRQQKVTRYFIAHHGGSFIKISPPPAKYGVGWYKKGQGVSEHDYFDWHEQNGNEWVPHIHTKNQGTYVETRGAISKGWKVEVCNDIRTCHWNNINYDYYIAEAHKLVDCIK